ncbi:MAG: HEAT repeat domain-containing protein, partial [Planctomycetota bacterium]
LVLSTSFSFARLLDRHVIEDHEESELLEARLLDLTERAVSNETLTTSVRVNLAILAYEHGLRSEALVGVIRSNVALATRHRGDKLEDLARLAILPDRPLPGDLPSELLNWVFSSPTVFGSPDKLAELVEVAASRLPSDDPVSRKAWKELGLQWELDPSFPPTVVERIMRAVGAAKDPRATEAWIDGGGWLHTVDQALAAWRGAASASPEHRGVIRSEVAYWLAQQLPDGRERADVTLKLFLTTPDAADLVKSRFTMSEGGPRSGTYNDRVHVERTVRAISPARVPDAVTWLADPASPLHEYRYANGAGWIEADQELRAILNGADRSAEEWLLAAASLLTSGKSTPQDRDQIVTRLSQYAASSKKPEETARELTGLIRGSNGDSSLHWSEVSAALMEDARVPDAVASVLPLNVAAETDEERRIAVRFLDAAEARAKKAAQTIRFTGSEYYGVRAAARDKSLVRPTLMRTWIQGRTITDDLLDAVKAAQDPVLTAALRARLVDLVERTSGPTRIRKASALMKLPGDEPIQALIEIAMTSDDGKFTEYVDEKISRLIRLREAASRWSSAASGIAPRAEAVQEVLKLVDSPDVAVRVEAIHGLGVLEAVEALPTLIPLVADENAEVRAAARATLKRLREPRPAEVESPSDPEQASGR